LPSRGGRGCRLLECLLGGVTSRGFYASREEAIAVVRALETGKMQIVESESAERS
jgi:hypothetical protein